MVENIQTQVKEIPAGVKVISILYYIIAALSVIILILGSFIVLGGSDTNYTFVILLAVLLLGFAILSFFLGRGLWKGDNWSRIVAIVIAILNIIVTIAMIIIFSYLSNQIVSANNSQNILSILNIFDLSKFIPKAIIDIVINGIIAGYLLFSNKVKKAFK